MGRAFLPAQKYVTKLMCQYHGNLRPNEPLLRSMIRFKSNRYDYRRKLLHYQKFDRPHAPHARD